MVRLTEEQSISVAAKKADALRLAVIGYGYWGPNLVRNFFEAPDSTVTAVCDLDQDRLAALAKRYPSIALTTDYRGILSDPSVDAVAIATPVSTHYPLAREALEAGKHVWVEKPLADNYRDAQRLTELAARKGQVLMVDHTFVYTPAVQRMRASIDRGELGELFYYDSVRVNLGLFQRDVNVIWDLGVHDVSIIDYLLPHRPIAVSAVGACHIGADSESIAYVTMHFQENLMAHFHVNWLAPVKIRMATLCGSRRMIVYDDTAPSEKIRIYDRGVTVNGNREDRARLLVEYRSGDMHSPKLEQTEALQVAARHFCSCIASGDRPLTDGEAGARTVALLEAAERSISEGGRLQRVTW